jgi:prepilin-type N-terminal cleavage/methylation domain-containing protein
MNQFTTPAHAQAGLTLIEVLVSLSIFALVVGAALALYGSAGSSQTTTQMNAQLAGIRAATKSLYFGQGGYGTSSLGEVLINGKKIPTSMPITGTAPSRVINHSQAGTVTITGATSNFTITSTNISTDVCIGLAASTGWTGIKIGAAAVNTTFPISPSTASTQCVATDPITIIFTAV